MAFIDALKLPGYKFASGSVLLRLLLPLAAIVGTASEAGAQSCVGTTDIVCTHSGANGVISDPTVPISSTTNITSILTTGGTATAITTESGENGNSVIVNYGTVAGRITATAGVFSGNSFTASATIINHGTAFILHAKTDFAGDAIVYNDGYVSGAIIADVNVSIFGAPKIYNSGYAGTLFIRGLATFYGEGLIQNSGTTNSIILNLFGDAKVINSGYATAISIDSIGDTVAKTINTGTVNGDITTLQELGYLRANTETINSGSARDITTTTNSVRGDATTTNTAAAVARDISTGVGGSGNATNINYGIAASIFSNAKDGAATIINYGIVGPSLNFNAALQAQNFTGPGTIFNAGTVFGSVAVITPPGTNGLFATSTVTNAGLIDAGASIYGAINLFTNPVDRNIILNLLPASRINGSILLNGDVTNPDSVGTTINIQGGARASSVLTFGNSRGIHGLVDTGSTVNVTDVPYVINGNTVAVVDPTPFAVAGRNVVDVTHAIAAMTSARLDSGPQATSEGPAIGFAPSGNLARDMADDAFASMPLAYAGQDRVLGGNPNFTASDGTSVWAQGFGGRRGTSSDGSVLASTNSFYGAALGVDKMVMPTLRLGAMVGGGHLQSNLDMNSGRTSSDLAFAGVYGRYALSRGFVDFALLGGGSSNDTSRFVNNNLNFAASGIEYAKARYAGWFVSPELAFGYDQPLGLNVTLTPNIRLRYLAAGFGGYQESGSAADMTVDSRLAHYFEERAGIAISKNFSGVARGELKLTGTAGAVMLQRAGDSGVNAVLLGQSLAFATPGQGNIAGYYTSVGIDWRHASGVSLFAATEFNIMSDATQTITGRGGIKIAF